MKLGTHLDRILAGIRRRMNRFWDFQQFETLQLRAIKTNEHLNFQILEDYSDEFQITEDDPRIESSTTHYFDSRKIYRIEEVLLEPRQGLMFTPSNKLILESTNWTSTEVWDSYPRANVFNYEEYREEITFLTSRVYYHWLIEDLPNFLKIQEKNPRIKVAIHKKAPNYVLESLENHSGEIRAISGPSKFDSVIFVSKSNDIGKPHPQDLQILRDKFQFLLGHSSIGKRIYISRRKSSRSPRNEMQIEKLFKQYDFEIVEAEELRLHEQIMLFSQASIIAGTHGSGLTNMVWLQSGSMVIDLVYRTFWTECFFRLANRLNLEYVPFPIDGSVGDAIDLNDLERFIRARM